MISRTSTTRYKTEHPSLPEIARALGVDLLVEGSVLQVGDQVRITAQLIDGTTDEHLWSIDARDVFEAERPKREVALAQLDAATGDHAAAFRALKRLAARGNLPPVLAFDPLFEPLRRQPEWQALAPRLSLISGQVP